MAERCDFKGGSNNSGGVEDVKTCCTSPKIEHTTSRSYPNKKFPRCQMCGHFLCSKCSYKTFHIRLFVKHSSKHKVHKLHKV